MRTAVTYATIITLTVVTFIIFMIEISTWSRQNWEQFPWTVKLPLCLNPVFFLTIGFAPAQQLFPELVCCLGIFVFLGLLDAG
jgi:hypothetical protein